jgi:hypothetical protein
MIITVVMSNNSVPTMKNILPITNVAQLPAAPPIDRRKLAINEMIKKSGSVTLTEA